MDDRVERGDRVIRLGGEVDVRKVGLDERRRRRGCAREAELPLRDLDSGDVEPFREASDLRSVPGAEIEHAGALDKADGQVVEEALPGISLHPRHPLAEAIRKGVVARLDSLLALVRDAHRGGPRGTDPIIFSPTVRYS